ncbi:hypothetical protein K4F52_002940 [Lecanicillium sp. MT-2017a]|nr:hypothetical protein K4F52_002940 [Lecanicillium sp. MT-2017a]
MPGSIWIFLERREQSGHTEAIATELYINNIRAFTTSLRVGIRRSQAVALRQHTRSQCNDLLKDGKEDQCRVHPQVSIRVGLKGRGQGKDQDQGNIRHTLNFPTHGPGEGVPAWSDMLRRTGLGGSGMGAEGQQAFMTLPGSETPIAVQVDYSQASKKADEKRQRNAKASTRHRRKKKTIQEENVRQIQEMREERDDLADQIEHVTRQRDFYRDERNRLRDIVLRTPAIAQHASGPPSPTSVRSVTSFPDRSPVAPSRQMPTPSQGYVSESSSVERPAQRRRTDERPEYPGNYSTQAGPPPSTLPPMHGHVQGMPPRPSSASSLVPLERLPPLRTIEGHHPPPDIAHGQPHERDPATGDWRPAQPRPYETGWATPRNAGDVGPPR